MADEDKGTLCSHPFDRATVEHTVLLNIRPLDVSLCVLVALGGSTSKQIK